MKGEHGARTPQPDAPEVDADLADALDLAAAMTDQVAPVVPADVGPMRPIAEDAELPEPPSVPPVAANPVPRSIRRPWMRRYRITVMSGDALSAAAAALIAVLFRFGDLANSAPTAYVRGVFILPGLWVAILALGRAYDARIVGLGAEEFQRIWRGVVYLTAAVAAGAYLTKVEVARGFLLVAVPLTVGLTTLSRYLVRRGLHSVRKRRGVALSRVVVLGDAAHAVDLAEEMVRDAYAGLRPVGVCLTAATPQSPDLLDRLAEMDVPVVGDPDDLLATVATLDADAVAVTASHGLGAHKLRWISWQLEGTGIDLMVAPGLIEVTGRRLHVRPMSVVPLLQVEAPRFSGMTRVVKGAFDRTGAALALLALLPVLLTLAVLVRLTSPGPALFRQVRVGRDGKPFTMIKFRSMFADAEQRLAELLPANVHGDGVLFKLRDDPRVTPLGRVLRKFSLDELPQLINVLTGSMSLVGPRPPLPREVARYGDDVRRRLLVKPGVTGLWQISGRSDLSWEESVRLDLRYVENWSLASDIQILWKTLAAVVRPSGAY